MREVNDLQIVTKLFKLRTRVSHKLGVCRYNNTEVID